MSERMTAEELAKQVGRILYPGDGNWLSRNATRDIAARIEADPRLAERLCAEWAISYLRDMGFMIDEDAEIKLRAAITSPAKEDSHE